MGGRPCVLKAILNGESVSNEATSLVTQLRDPNLVLDDDYGYKLVEHLNAAEDAVFQAKRVFLESQGYTGPWPKSLS